MDRQDPVLHARGGADLPSPHHDIYSIEDLAQLIYDLKNANDQARIHVKLVAEVGVGTVAAGVSKAHADVVLISGHDGGTGAAPLNSLKHAGAPWELGLAETQQTLMLNGLRDRIVVQVDGQLKTGRDVVIAALLGAEEFGFASAPLVVSGCIMMRVCQLDTCPVGIATQNPELRKRFAGSPDFVVTFFEYIAEEVRELLAELGFRTIDEAVGHPEVIDHTAAVGHWKAAGLDLSPILEASVAPPDTPRHQVVAQDHGLDKALDVELIAESRPALDDALPVSISKRIRNVNRTVGTLLGAEVTRRYGGAGLPDGTIDVSLVGSAGQSLGAFLPAGITLRLEGDANDYVGKGLSGGRIILRPSPDAPPEAIASEQIIAGNVILYGATAGEAFVRGVVGERFAVRNSGALAVVEGVGDHGCEYMTGGRVVVLGGTGRNFGAGMSGGIAFVWDPDGVFAPPGQPGDGRPGRPRSGGRDVAGRGRRPPPRRDRVHGRRRPARRVAQGQGDVRESHAQGLPASARCGAQPPSATGSRSKRRSWRPPMGDKAGFLKHGRELPTRRQIPVRLRDWKEVYEPFGEDNLRTQASRCMDCGIPFCNDGCPLGNLIPDWNDLVYRDHWQAAIESLHATNNFPEFTGRLCPAPCEAACVLGINADPVTIKQVEQSIIDRAWEAGWVTPIHPDTLTGKKVAVIGSGPSGLAAAQQLTRAGHTVIVYERADRPGGLLRYGIPEFKMEKAVLDRRLAQMRAEGTQFACGVDVGVDIDAAQLRREFHAVVIAAGSTEGRDLPIPGRQLDGIHQAMEYLPYANRVQQGDIDESPISADGKRVVIIGGGDTGADCLGTAHRQGALSVHQFEIMPRPPDRPRRYDALAAVAAHAAHLRRPRGGRRAGLRRQHRELRRRRPRPGGRPAGPRGGDAHRRRPAPLRQGGGKRVRAARASWSSWRSASPDRPPPWPSTWG